MIVSSAGNNSIILDDVVSSEIWDDALAEYARNSGLDIGALPRVRNLDEILDLIETKQSNFKLHRHDGKRLDKIRSAVGRNLADVQRITEAVFFTAGRAFAPTEAIYGAIQMLIEAAQNVSEGFEKISEGFEVMKEYFDQLHILMGNTITPSLKKAVLKVFLHTVIMLRKSYYYISKSRTGHFMKNVSRWKYDNLQAILQAYKDAIEEQQAVIRTESYVNSATLVKNLETFDQKSDNQHMNLTTDVKQVDQKLSNLEIQLNTQRKNTETEDLLKWLTEMSFEETHQKFLRQRHKGTCEWLFQHQSFQRWFAGSDGRILWCNGKAGAGKSTLASAAVEHMKTSTEMEFCEDRNSRNCRIAISYFYCDNYNEKTHSQIELLSVISKSLLKESSLFAEEAALLRKKVGGRASEDDLSALIQSNAKYFGRIFVIIDALDECPRSSRIKFAKLIEKLEPSIHFFVTSRSNIELKSLIRISFSSIKIDDANKLDIKTYLGSMVDEDADFNDVIECEPEAREKVISTIADGVDGMFLLAHYQILDVCEQGTLEDVYSCLESSLNMSVNNYYEKNLQRVEQLQDKAKTLTKRAIAYVHYAKRPLKVDELCHALSIRDGDSEVNFLRIPALGVLRNHSAGLIVFGEDGTLGLVHLTLHEYFNEHPEKLESNFSEPQSEADFASACLVYLSFDTFSTGPCKSNDTLKARLREYPFLEYAAHNLGFHLKRIPVFQENERFRSLLELLNSSHKVSSLLQILYLPKYWTTKSYNRFPKTCSALHIAAYFDLHELFPQLCKDFADLNSEDCSQFTPLQVAAERGHHISLKSLIDRVSYLPGYIIYQILAVAAENGHHQAVKVLLVHHAVAEFLGSSDISTIFCAAVRQGHVDVAMSFWDKYSNDDADLWNDLDSFIIIIAEHGTVEVAEGILDKSSGDWKPLGKTLMRSAVVHGNKEIWNMLLRKGISFPSWEEVENVRCLVSDRVFSDFSLTSHLLRHRLKANTKTRDDATGLIVAAAKGQEDVAQLLLENGADVNAYDLREFTPLLYAAAMGWEKLVEMLIEKGADPNLTDERGWLTPLCVASLKEHRSIAHLLIEKTAGSKEITDFVGRLMKENHPLHQLMNVAVERRTMYVNYWRPSSDSSATYGRGQDLLETGADIDTRHKNGCTALFTAARDDDLETLEFLLANGAKVNEKNRFGETALHATCMFGNGESASILLDNKAEVNAQAFGRTPLLLAAQEGNFSTVRYLAQRGADVHAQDCHGRRAIHWCAAVGSCNDLEVLIGEGADVNIKDYWGKTPLLCTLIHHFGKTPFRWILATQQDYFHISSSKLEVLLRNNAEINTKTRDGCAALHFAVLSPSVDILRHLLGVKDIAKSPKAKGNFRPIDIAIIAGNVSKTKLLLEHGAEMKAENHLCTINFEFEDDLSGYYAVVDETLFRESYIVYNNLINYLCSKLLEYGWNNPEADVIDEAISYKGEECDVTHLFKGGQINLDPAKFSDGESLFDGNWLDEESDGEELNGKWEDKILSTIWEPCNLKSLYKGKKVKTEYTVLDLAIFSGNQEIRQLVEDDLEKSKTTCA